MKDRGESLMDEPAASPPPWQFSIRQLLVVTAAVGLLLGVCLSNPGVAEIHAMYLAAFLFGLLATLAGPNSDWRFAVPAGVICTALVHLILWLKFLGNGKYDDELLFIYSVPVGLVAVLDIWVLGRGGNLEATSDAAERITYPTAARLRRTAWESAAAIIGMLLVSPLFLDPDGAVAGIYVAFPLFCLAVAPWLVAWRRRGPAGFVYPEPWPECMAKYLILSAVPIAMSSALPLVLFLVLPHGVQGWDAVTPLVVCVFFLLGAHGLGLLMVILSVVIQWYRNCWLLLGNALTLGYFALSAIVFWAFG